MTGNIVSYCFCEEGYFGQYCDQLDTTKYENSCDKGTLDTNNTVTLCNCRNNDGDVLDKHGWHCDIPNSVICDNRRGQGYKALYFFGHLKSPDCRVLESLIRQ